MKKFFASLFVAFSMFAMVSCGNPAIDAAEDFLDKPTQENADKVTKALEKCDDDEKKEFAEWLKKNADKWEKAEEKLNE